MSPNSSRPTPSETRPESLVALVRAARREGDERLSREGFSALVVAMEPTMRALCLGYSRDRLRGYDEIRQECLIVLDRAVDGYLPDVGARVAFLAFYTRNAKKALALTYRRAQSAYSGSGVRMQRKVAKLVVKAREAGVDVADAQAVLDFAVAHGARRNIVVRQLPLIAGVTSLDAPLVDKSGASSARVIDFVPEVRDEDPAYPEEFVRLAGAHLDALPETQRRVLVRLFGLDGRPEATLAEIAREENRDVTSIAERRDRALRKLRATMAPAYAREFGACA